ncbi:MAG: hypothetical protein ACKO35_03605 [Planctomycetaceae bacterium]
MHPSRRTALRTLVGGWATLLAGGSRHGADAAPPPPAVPVRTITRGPKHHWFAYYDKLQFDPSIRYCLGNAVEFEHRSPRPDDEIEVGMVDLKDGDRWIPLGTSRSWGWQQGCMLQWVPGTESTVIYNDREGDRFVARVVDVTTRRGRTVPHAIYAIAPDGRTAVTTDFRRINEMRPGYGYAGLPDPWTALTAPSDVGIQRVDLETGEVTMLVSLAEIVAIPRPGGFGPGKHWFNHLLVSPDGQRTIFLHRWRTEPGRFATRMFTIGLDGTGLRELNPGAGMVSHFIWRDADHILAWTRHPTEGECFCIMEDAVDGGIAPIGREAMPRDGHCTYLPGGRWIVNDTYPQGPDRLQRVYLYEVATGRRVDLGAFPSPADYTGEWRCDTHPRHSPDGRWLCIDSPHTGSGRQMHLLDIGSVVAS